MWYRQRGYEVIDRNWRCAVGEIDLVVRGYGVVVFSEVKTRASDRYGIGGDAVGVAKQRRLRQLAALWLAEHPAAHGALRFDVVSIVGTELTVLEAAF